MRLFLLFDRCWEWEWKWEKERWDDRTYLWTSHMDMSRGLLAAPAEGDFCFGTDVVEFLFLFFWGLILDRIREGYLGASG